ncbi:MAG: aminotransferase class V-fold PLP-dependent enzyme [Ignavibacteriales bacterium]|nr:aminotransferase class V-fold PLP-dependent enzyme [Ignavibacteriales bacterium]
MKLSSIEECRNLFPFAQKYVYLDSAHYCPYSLESKRRLDEFIYNFTHNHVNLSLANFHNSRLLKDKAAELINADPDDIIITSSTTHGLNIFANGIRLNAGDTVAYADSEFPAVVYPWMNQEKLRGLKSVMIPSENGKMKLADIEMTISENNVKVLTISIVEFLGFKNDIGSILDICRKYGCLLVTDGIQSTGIVPFDVKLYDVDYFATGSQKWMMSPSGIGFAYIARRNRDKVAPTYAGTSSVKYDFKKFLDYKLDFSDDGSAYENSTLNCLGMIGLISSIELFLKLGVENIFNHILKLLDLFVEKIDESKFMIESSLEKKHRSGILIFSHKESSKNEAIQKYLEQCGIYVALREGFLRISPHIFNNEQDILKLVDELNHFNEQ